MQKKAEWKKVVKSKVAAQKWLWWSDNGKIINSNNSGEFVLPPPTGNRHQNSPELLLLKILPLSDHHSHFRAATFDFTTFFMLPFFAWAAPFFTVWLFLCRFHFFLQFNLYFCFYRLQLQCKQDELTPAKLSSDRPNSSWTAFLVIWTVYWVTW